MANSLGFIIRSARTAAGLTQQALADLVGVSRAAIGQWESDAHEPSTENFIAVCKALGVDIESAVRGQYKSISSSSTINNTVSETLSAGDAFKLMGGLSRAAYSNIYPKTMKKLPLFVGTSENHPPYSYLSVEPFAEVPCPSFLANLKDVYCVLNPDDYLFPKYERDEYIYASANDVAKPGDYVIVRTGVFSEVARPTGGEGIKTERCLFGRMVGIDIFGTNIKQYNPDSNISAPKYSSVKMHRIFSPTDMVMMSL